jgi:hypothetical protein
MNKRTISTVEISGPCSRIAYSWIWPTYMASKTFLSRLQVRTKEDWRRKMPQPTKYQNLNVKCTRENYIWGCYVVDDEAPVPGRRLAGDLTTGKSHHKSRVAPLSEISGDPKTMHVFWKISWRERLGTLQKKSFLTRCGWHLHLY